MFLEGKKYRFKIIRLIDMPPDGEEHFVLEGENGIKFLMLKKYYEHYQLEAGQEIICKIDKVNCSGRMFLEPEHPYCKVGDLLSFVKLALVTQVNAFGDEEKLLHLRDPWGLDAQLNINHNSQLSDCKEIKCRIERIKKGQLLISDPDFNYFNDEIITLSDQNFVIHDIITLSENIEFYRLQQGNSYHYLRTKYYSKYHFEKGQRIQCRILAQAGLFQHYLEPEHPHYIPGQTYWFDFIRKENPGELTDKPHHRLIVRDLLGHEYPLILEGDCPPWIKRVNCLVKEIKMSKCTLELIDIE